MLDKKMSKSCNAAFQYKTFGYEFGLVTKLSYLVCLNVKCYRFTNTNHNKLRDSNFLRMQSWQHRNKVF